MLADYHVHTEFLRLYRDLGGSIVTIGSDSHAPARLGTYLQDAKARLKELGFQNFCTYQAMQPVFHSILILVYTQGGILMRKAGYGIKDPVGVRARSAGLLPAHGMDSTVAVAKTAPAIPLCGGR